FLIHDPKTHQVIGMAMITRDITTQRAARDELESTNQRLSATMSALVESQRALQGILDYSPNAIVIKTLDGRYTTVNNAFCAITRLDPEEARGRYDADLFPSPLAQRLRANDERAIDSRESIVTEESLERDGDRRVFVVTKFPLFDTANRIFALASIWTEITQRKRDEEALREAAADMGTAQRVAHVGSWQWDLRNDDVQWSEELYRIFGLDPSHAEKRPSILAANTSPLTEESRQHLQSIVDK